MTDPSGIRPVVPGFALRIGVTGTRHLPAAQLTRVEQRVRSVLTLVADTARALAANPKVAAVYAPDPDGVVRPHLRLLSPLAEGADRLVARAALELGYRLDAPLPFERADYAGDFTQPESLAEFEALLTRASDCTPDGRPRVLELDGGRHEDGPASYGAVGRLIVRNCDLLIAVWHGHPGKGPGGTADIVRFGARSGPPVWWIHSGETAPGQDDAPAAAPEDAPEPAWIETLAQLRRPYTLDRGAKAEARLRAYLEAIITPPPPLPPLREGVFGRLFGHAHPPLPRFYSETLPMERQGTGWLWHSEKWVMNAALRAGVRIESGLDWAEAGLHRVGTAVRRLPPAEHRAEATRRRKRPVQDASPATAPAATLPDGAAPPFGYWSRLYHVVDGLATGYANRYRSSYAIVTVAATLALFAAGLHQLWHGGGVALSLVELLSLTVLLAFVGVNHWAHWHERWISYRLLAELCRKQRALSLFAWSLPAGETWRVAMGEAGGTRGGIYVVAARDAWVGWYFHAAMRAAPLPSCRFDSTALVKTCLVVESSLIDEQVGYHENRAQKSGWQSRGLVGLGELLLLATALLVLVKTIVVLFSPHSVGVDWLAAVANLLVVFSVAFITLRVYAELDLLAEGSAAMAAMMRTAKVRLEVLRQPKPQELRGPGESEDGLLPLTSQDMGSAVYELALDMLSETEGWARLFNVKDVEAA